MKSWSYEKAGVPHLKGDPTYNNKISRLIKSTRVPGVMGSPTGFAALFDPKKSGVKDPILVGATDGVGTKLEIARLQKKHDTIGIDLVAMCVNDLITSGAQPLFFLDYFATGRFDAKMTQEVLKGITTGCRQAACALIGGETAIMPGFYASHAGGAGQYDLAGFSVGVVERRKVLTGDKIRAGDVLLGIPSSGFHSNGYSLLRKLFSKRELSGKIGRQLLTPTLIYVKPALALLKHIKVRGLINITGGGLPDNLPRVIPSGLKAQIYKGSWRIPKLFQLVQNSGNIPDFEMFRTFNMGVGMVAVLAKRDVPQAQRLLKRFKLASWTLGKVVKAGSAKETVEIIA